MTSEEIDAITQLLGADRYLDALDRLMPHLYPAQGPPDDGAARLRERAFAALGQDPVMAAKLWAASEALTGATAI